MTFRIERHMVIDHVSFFDIMRDDERRKGDKNVGKKAVFFDIDGTLWDEHAVIPESTRRAIAMLRENGHYAFICSGRTRAFIREEQLLSLGFDGIISGCGTQVEFRGETLFYKCLERELIRDTIHILKKYHIPTVCEGRYQLYMDREDFADDTLGRQLCHVLGDDLQKITGNEDTMEISKFSCMASVESFGELSLALEEHFTPLVHDYSCVEFVPKGFSKASGIKKACELLGIAREDTYAFGDSVNDIEMLRYVAHGIVMGNGTRAAKEAGDYITASLHEDGIYKGLEHFELI